MAEFDVKVGSFKGQADLDFNPKNIFMSIGDKIDEETTGDIAKFYRQYETPLAGLLGLGKLAAGKSIDPPLYERGPHSFGIRDLNLEDWPTGVYGYNTDDFNLEAEAGPQGDGWMAGLRGTYNFAEGGLAGSPPGRMPWNPNYQWKPEYESLRGGVGYEPWLMRNIPLDQWEQMSQYDRTGFRLEDLDPKMRKQFEEKELMSPNIESSYIPGPQVPTPEDRTDYGRLDGPSAPLPRQPGFSASPALSARTSEQPLSAAPRNPYSSSVANHPLVSEPTIPFPGGGLSSLDRVGWGAF